MADLAGSSVVWKETTWRLFYQESEFLGTLHTLKIYELTVDLQTPATPFIKTGAQRGAISG